MARYVGSTIDVPEWVTVSADRLCPVCGASSGCSLLEYDGLVCCVNIVCERPVLNGGWLHQLSDSHARTPAPS
jgi:hypothetical protein